MWLSKFIGVVGLFAVLTTQCVAQQDHAILERIEQSVTRQQSKWTLVKKTLIRNTNIAFYEWRSGKSSVAAFIFLTESSDAAIAALENPYDPFGEIKLSDKISNLGDDNYLWKARFTKGTVGADFRKGKFAVHVSAGTFADAKLFAQAISNAIDAT